MKLEFFLLCITGFVVMNIYHDGKYMKLLISWKKYYKMALVCFLSLSFYLFIKKNPRKSGELIQHSANYVKYMPLDRETSRLVNPIFDFTAKSEFFGNEYISSQEKRMMESGRHNQSYGVGMVKGNRHKRSVSETKKKYVASKQNWNCAHCNNQLSAWFEVDHILKLEDGGTNNVDNLRALCRECHGEKTGMENL